MSYDHWKTTNPADDYLGPEPTTDDTVSEWEYIAAEAAQQRNRFAAALRKIAGWKGYAPAPLFFDSDVPLTEYEKGANDMLETLAGFAKEALS